MTRRRPRIAILGGGMAGLAAAWRLSEPGRRDQFESITVYQRGCRLGGKGASSRGRHGRIEEHGLHVWLGYYENAFRLLRECYAELDRADTDPTAPIRTWRDAIVPAPDVGVEDRYDGTWRHWVGRFAVNDELPGEPDAPGGVMTVAEFLRRSLRLLQDFVRSLPGAEVGSGQVTLSTDPRPPVAGVPSAGTAWGLGTTASAAVLEAVRLTVAQRPFGGFGPFGRPDQVVLPALDGALDTVRRALRTFGDADDGLRRSWHLVSLVTATVRGIIADGLLTDPRGFRKVNDETSSGWLARHGAAPEAIDSAWMRGLYDLVFAYEDGDPERPSFAAGWGVFLSGKIFFDYKGAIFWKMTAGMGDVVFAPLYQVLRRRGVEFAFFHRVDQLHLSSDRTAIDAVSLGVQARLAEGIDHYEPLVRVRGLPCFPAAPLAAQLAGADGVENHDLESHWCDWPDADRRRLRRGEDFDVAVFAVPVGMAGLVCRELIADRAEWRAMASNVRTVATQAFQLWLREDERTLGWHRPGATVSGYAPPFDTWASMPQLIEAEDWPVDERPRTIAYFCSSLAAPSAPTAPFPSAPAADDGGSPDFYRAQVRANALRFVSEDLGHLLPGAVKDGGFRWGLLCGSDGASGPEAFDSQFWAANVDPSDRYVQSVAGTDQYRLRPDESGYDNLYLAGDWTDCGLNAGCIEAAVLSGLQAANAVLGRPRHHRIAGHYLL